MVKAAEPLPCHEPVFSRRYIRPAESTVTRRLAGPTVRDHHDSRIHIGMHVAIYLHHAGPRECHASALSLGVIAEIERTCGGERENVVKYQVQIGKLYRRSLR